MNTNKPFHKLNNDLNSELTGAITLELPNKPSKSNNKPFDYWLKKNKYYHKKLIEFFQFAVQENSKVLVINCKNGYLLDALKPSFGVGLDDDLQALEAARSRYPNYQFFTINPSLNSLLRSSGASKGKAGRPFDKLRMSEVEEILNSGIKQETELETSVKFDYIILPSVTMETDDIQTLFEDLHKFCDSNTRIIIDTYSYFWEPVLKITQKLGMRRPTNLKNWVSKNDMQNFLYLSKYETVTQGYRMLIPFYIPLISTFFNSFLAQIPLIQRLCLHEWIIARKTTEILDKKNYSVSVIVPCKNERGNVELAIKKCPNMGKFTEIIFVEGGSKDGTWEEIERVTSFYKNNQIKYYKQDGKGKGDAVRKGFENASGDILMILDADLTTPPEELTKFFDAIINGKGEFINGSRLVYGMESGAMRFMAILANFCFGLLLRWIIGQKIKDSLCGTKVLFRNDYKKIVENRKIFGNLDPFGDFDLLFGAAKLNLKIVDMPVHYKDRKYGETQISRYKYFWFLLLMSFIAWRKFKIK